MRIRDKKMTSQIMVKSEGEVDGSPPFTHVAMDQFGPVVVKDPAKGRRRFDCNVTLFACLGTKAVACMLHRAPMHKYSLTP